MTTLEFILIPLCFLFLVAVYVVEQKRRGTAKVVTELNDHVKKQTENIAKQLSVIQLLKSNRCGKHVHDIDDRVLLLTQMQGLSHRITEIFIKKNRETIYTCRKGDSAIRVPEHLVKVVEEPVKD
jgi:hypothetical protein